MVRDIVCLTRCRGVHEVGLVLAYRPQDPVVDVSWQGVVLIDDYRADSSAHAEEPLLRLIGPEGDAVAGLQRFEALALREVRKVSFFLDNEPILTKNRPPFDIDLDVGPLPKLTSVMAVGYDAEGNEIARNLVDGLILGAGSRDIVTTVGSFCNHPEYIAAVNARISPMMVPSSPSSVAILASVAR